jgi:glycosyltransferase involved in cell wall biosynthesis
VRVLYFSRDYTPHDHRFLIALAATSHRVFYLRLEHAPRQVEDRPVPEQVEQVKWEGGNTLFQWEHLPQTALQIRRAIRKIQPELVHAGPVQSTAFLSALCGVKPLVTMSWGSDLLKVADQSAWMRWVTRYTLRRSTVLVGDCKAVQQKAVEFGFPEQKVFLFPWGVDLEDFQPGDVSTFRQRLGWENAFILLSMRSWEPLYGVDVLVRAFARIADQAPEMRLLLLGGGSQAGLLRKILIQHGLMERVYLGGQVSQNELPRLYRTADLYVSASHTDGSSVSLMEALACGKPVLVSRIPGNQEWITEGQEGWLFQDGAEEELAARLLKTYQERADLPAMGQAARRLAEARADWKKNFQVLLQAYDAAKKVNEVLPRYGA